MTAGRNPSSVVALLCVLFALAFGCEACGTVPAGRSPAKASSTTSWSSDPNPTAPLVAPKLSAAQDETFFTQVTGADPALAGYEQKEGDVALRALLTDGSAFCALLHRGGGVDQALVGVAAGARGDESQTHLPLSVTTFNTIEAVALLTLCPSSQKLLPAADRSKLRKLGDDLAKQPGAA